MRQRVHVNGNGSEQDLAAIAASSAVQEVEPGVYLISGVNGAVVEARVTTGLEGSQIVWIGSNRFEVLIEDPRSLSRGAGAAGGEGRRKINAMMPGKVIRVLVAEGDQVDEGQGLVVVEAMKMQNEMKSPKSGKVTQLMTRAGATVAAGETLLVVE